VIVPHNYNLCRWIVLADDPATVNLHLRPDRPATTLSVRLNAVSMMWGTSLPDAGGLGRMFGQTAITVLSDRPRASSRHCRCRKRRRMVGRLPARSSDEPVIGGMSDQHWGVKS
jgi:hypothetical protein